MSPAEPGSWRGSRPSTWGPAARWWAWTSTRGCWRSPCRGPQVGPVRQAGQAAGRVGQMQRLSAAALHGQEAVGQEGRGRVVMEPVPAPALDLVQPELVLELQ